MKKSSELRKFFREIDNRAAIGLIVLSVIVLAMSLLYISNILF